jgi:hypothetical protein
MSIENTDLERRVLAHEQILQVLIAHLAEAEPKFLDGLKEIFTQQRTLGANEHDYTDTAAYAEQFIQQVVRRHGHDLGFSVGISQGFATLGQIGFAERMDYTAIGQ